LERRTMDRTKIELTNFKVLRAIRKSKKLRNRKMREVFFRYSRFIYLMERKKCINQSQTQK